MDNLITDPVDGMKTCARCKTSRPEEAFHPNRAQRSGLATYCKSCTLAHRRELTKAKRSRKPLLPHGEKRCSRCKLIKSVSDFRVQNRAKDGLQCQCVACAKLARRAKLAENASKTEIVPEFLTCTRCHECKRSSEFYKNREYSNGLDNNCKTCADKATRRYYEKAKDTDPIRCKLGRTLTNTKWRARKLSMPYDLDLNYMMEKFSNLRYCPVLGIELDWDCPKLSPNSPSLDKIIPELGYVRGNIQIISQRANHMKFDANLQELTDFATWSLQMVESEIDKIARFYLNDVKTDMPQSVLDIAGRYVERVAETTSV